MKIIIETPYGKVESMEMSESVKEIQEVSETAFGNNLQYLTIETKEGPVILASECTKRSMIRITK